MTKNLSILSFNILNDFEFKKHCHQSNDNDDELKLNIFKINGLIQDKIWKNMI
jgi:hypothetical protein